jgi:hypothetical protein
MKPSPIKYWLAFTPQWFKRHQGELLWLANHRWLSGVFRRRLNLRPDMRVVSITPDAVNYASDGPECVLIAYPGPVVAMDIYCAFKPLWWAIHYWDELIADRYLPELSYGFDTLTGNTQTSGQYFDGAIQGSSTSYSDASTLTGSVSALYPTDGSELGLEWSKVGGVGGNFFLSKLYFKFNLTSVTGTVLTSATVFSIGAVNEKAENITGVQILLREAQIGDSDTAFVTGNSGDWTKIQPTTFAYLTSQTTSLYPTSNPFVYYNPDTDSNNLFTFSETGRLHVTSKIGSVLKLGLIHSRTGSTPSSVSKATFYAAESTVYSSARPKITITYTRAIYPTGIASTATFGAFTASAGAPVMQPTGLASTATFGTLTISNVILPINPTGIASTVIFGTFRDATIRPTGLLNVNAFGSPFLGTTSPTGIASTLTFGAFTIAGQAFIARPTSIASGAQFGLFSVTSPFPTNIYIARLIDQPIDYGYEVYQFEDGGAEVNVQPCGARRWTVEYEGLSAAEIRQLIAHYNLMRGSSGTFNFYHRRDAVTYAGVRYVSLTIPQRQRASTNTATIVLEKLQ